MIGILVAAFLSFAHADTVPVDLPLVDLPYNLYEGAYTAPSMRQSLAVSSSFYEVSHRALLGPREDRPKWKIWLVVGFDIATMSLPFGHSWLHEEWHRATMGRRGISSYNDVYKFPIGQEIIAVSHVTDEDLVRFKRDYPAEHVRMSAAGMESQIAQNVHLERNQFFRASPDNNRMLFWLNNFSVTGYLASCASSEADRSTDRQNDGDGADVAKRDFTGLDCTAWAYDLFRPEEAYTARGTHPSGVGIDRYIRYSDLNNGERAFLKRQVGLSLLNFADPFLIGRNEFDARWFGEDVKWNARLSHQLTSFGYTVDAHGLFKWNQQKLHLRWHNGFNDKAYFPGLTVSWIDYPLHDRWFLTSDLTLWNQPRAQRYNARGGEMLVGGGTEVSYEFIKASRWYLGVEAKTPGWITGQVYVDRNVTVWSGARIGVF